MKKVLVLLSLAGLTACGTARFEAVEYQCKIEDNKVVCPDGSELVLEPGLDGTDGKDGSDGKDGENAVIVTVTNVPKNSCTKVAEGLYVENIKEGRFYDVYLNDKCQDKLGEYCDNVEPSYGSTGQFGENQPGGAEVCLAGSRMVVGERVGKDLSIRVFDFNVQ